MPRAKVNDTTISYKVQGNGEALVLIMGLGANKESWFMNLRTLSKHYKVIVFDSRGAGRTRGTGEPYTVREMSEDTIGLLDYLKIEKAHFVGVSLGSLVTQEIAIGFPQRVGKLVLAATWALMDDAVRKEDRDGKAGMPRRRGGLGDDFTQKIVNDPGSMDIEKTMRTFTAMSFGRRLFRIPMVLGARYYFKRGGFRGVSDQLQAASKHNTLDRLGQIKAPTLVMAGTDDKVIPIEFSRIVADRIPGAKFVEFESGSHSFFMEMSRRFNREVLAFLSSDG